MKKLLLAMLLLVGCASQETTVAEPEPVLAVGSTFELPCADPGHGTHLQTITAARREFVYEVTGDDGTVGFASEEQFLIFLEIYGIEVAPPAETR